MTMQRMEQFGQAEQAGQPQNGATAEHAAQTRRGTPDAGLFPAANSVQSGAPHGENPPAAERTQNAAQHDESSPVKGTAFSCRAMRPEDVPACAAIEAAVPDGWSAAALAEELLQPTARLFVAETSGGAAPGAQSGETNLASPTQPSGCQAPNAQPSNVPPTCEPAPYAPPTQSIAALAVFQLVCEEASLYTVSAAPAFRRQGAARALLQYAFVQLAAEGAQTVFLEVRAQNTAARALYAALGFAQTGVRRGFYTKPSDDAVLMRKTIHHSSFAGRVPNAGFRMRSIPIPNQGKREMRPANGFPALAAQTESAAKTEHITHSKRSKPS